MQLVWIALAGAIGSLLRYGVGIAALSITRTWPLGTLAVNLTGSLLIGVVAGYSASESLDETVRLAIVTGLLGGFTTYSAFNEELLSLLRAGSWWTAAIYLAVTIGGGLLAGAAGYAAAR